MKPSGEPAARRNHIRSIRHHFLGGERREAAAPPRPLAPRLNVSGRPGSPWPLPLAVNLALAVVQGGETVRVVLPARLLPAAARLLGAPAAGLGLDLTGRGGRGELSPWPGISLLADGQEPGPFPLPAPPGAGARTEPWRLHVHPGRGARGLWLCLLEEDADGIDDPREGAPGALVLLGLGGPPAAVPEGAAVWGGIPRDALLCPWRPERPSLRAPDPALRSRYAGYLEGLRRLCAGRAIARGAGR